MSHRSLRSSSVALSMAFVLSCAMVGWAAAQTSDPAQSSDPGQTPAAADTPDVEPSLPSPSAAPAVGETSLGGLPLEGPSWRLSGYRADGEMQAVAPETAAWLSLRRGRLRGATGCDELRGSYGRVGDALAVRTRGASNADCPGREANRVHRAMLQGLGSAASFELLPGDAGMEVQAGPATPTGPASVGTRLVIRDELGTDVLQLELDDVGRLEGDEWRLAAYTSAGERFPAVPEPPAVLELRPDERDAAARRSEGQTIGSSGCNGLVGTYDRTGDALSFADLEVSDAPCPEDLARQESAMLAVLGAELLLDMPPDRLVLTDPATGDRLEFVASSPLQGSTWLLTDLRGAQPFPDVTLRLENGVVQGEGPCGPYGGRYETNGVVLRLVDLVGGTQPCEAERQQDAFLDALRRAVLIERPRGRLRLHDAAGRQLARFRAPQGP